MIYVIIGLPGSGKTTVAKYLETKKGIRITFDTLFKKIFPGEKRGLGNEYSSEQLDIMYRAILPVIYYLSISGSGKNIIIDGVFRKKFQRKLLLNELDRQKLNYKIIEI